MWTYIDIDRYVKIDVQMRDFGKVHNYIYIYVHICFGRYFYLSCDTEERVLGLDTGFQQESCTLIANAAKSLFARMGIHV